MLQLLAIPLLLAPAANVSATDQDRRAPGERLGGRGTTSLLGSRHAGRGIASPIRGSLPMGRRSAVSLRVADLRANKGRNDIWIASLDGTQRHSLTGASGGNSQPRWSTGRQDHLLPVVADKDPAGLADPCHGR